MNKIIGMRTSCDSHKEQSISNSGQTLIPIDINPDRIINASNISSKECLKPNNISLGVNLSTEKIQNNLIEEKASLFIRKNDNNIICIEPEKDGKEDNHVNISEEEGLRLSNNVVISCHRCSDAMSKVKAILIKNHNAIQQNHVSSIHSFKSNPITCGNSKYNNLSKFNKKKLKNVKINLIQ